MCFVDLFDFADFANVMVLQLSPWGDWSKCSVACGVGKRMRRRMEKRGPCPVDTQYTEMEPCQGSLCQGE